MQPAIVIITPIKLCLFVLSMITGSRQTTLALEGGGGGNQQCHNENGSCDAWTSQEFYEQGQMICGMDPSRCGVPTKTPSSMNIYRHGGTAQAYKPHVPRRSTGNASSSPSSICNVTEYQDTRQHNVAKGPYSRWTSSTAPPTLKLTLLLWVCQTVESNTTTTTSTTTSSSSSWSTDNKQENKDCCCQPIRNLLEGTGDATVEETAEARATKGGDGTTPNKRDDTLTTVVVVEAWQARPNGSYASIRPGKDDDDCRARVVLDSSPSRITNTTNGGIVQFDTVAPGSVGSLGGLVPHSWLDWMPYRVPVLHFLVSSTSTTLSSSSSSSLSSSTSLFAPLLVDVPLLLDPKTLLRQEFSSNSYCRGPEYVKDKVVSAAAEAVATANDDDDDGSTTRTTTKLSTSLPIEITSWTPNVTANTIDISLNLYLEQQQAPPHPLSQEEEDSWLLQLSNQSMTNVLCNSLPFGFPASFFMEPISMCSPSMLDFFDL